MENILKCRALYLRSIALLFRSALVIDDTFLGILDNFLENYYFSYPDMFNLIYSFKEEDNKEENAERDNLLLKKYLFDLTVNDKAIKLYDEIGIDNVNKISILAEIFYEYYYEVMDIGNVRIRS